MKRHRGPSSGLRIEAFLDNFFFCPSCTAWRRTKPPRWTAISGSSSKSRNSSRRHASTSASTLISTTAVNAQKPVPPRYRPLYESLLDVRKRASAHVNLSRLQLALQGLESETPVTRVAILGLNAQDTANRVVRLLLADALEDEGSWERELVKSASSGDFSRGVLIRYGRAPNPNLPQPKTSIPVLHVPSNILERNNMELLVSSVSVPRNGELLQGAQTVTSDAFLSPSIGTPTAATGRQTTISQPVHSCLLVTGGLDGLMLAAELLASTNFTALEDRESVSLVVELKDFREKTQGQVLVVDAAKAEEGLAAIRRSIGEATEYEHKWVDSGMPLLSSWLTLASAARSEGPIPAPVKALISSLLTTAMTNLQVQASLETRSNAARSLSQAARANLEDAIEGFSRNAHQELQSGLASAWSSHNWRKLAWYKLFWRVDDVGLIITDLITNAWLPRTERAVYELSGRLSQAGISPMDAFPSLPQEGNLTMSKAEPEHLTEPTPVLHAQASVATEPPLRAVLVNTTGTAEVEMTPIPQPMPLSSSISKTRSEHMQRAIADLTSTAQQIVLKTLSITGLSGGLSALTYLSITPGSMYEAGTIAALGTAYALWRMQGDWFKATKALEHSLYDEGRTVIQRIVGRMEELVDTASRVVEDEVEVQSRRQAEDAVTRAKEELDRLQK
ncbi:uncharacterized protein Z520_10173 [Fonsecaea multimorphosa CBS 102226]|uniref:Mmc1 C-terminal domain-containing protein n=1 Tax=Fonsecaea multimorphosa CBS 102226 TaxID=1442371 RepID=A0A0D2JLG6_9EURO|nr:uncharacterized protein Z520_10173 [Fonsecaea multimorphosa CBS 102226]KIX94147.1 hypothetical protein Z520_10173 [Fonsecaea multimorphosa CBS 102226]OAL19500.1 hypothetical protein AYO22_09662 [Fonsecaea multimorphosa]